MCFAHLTSKWGMYTYSHVYSFYSSFRKRKKGIYVSTSVFLLFARTFCWWDLKHWPFNKSQFSCSLRRSAESAPFLIRWMVLGECNSFTSGWRTVSWHEDYAHYTTTAFSKHLILKYVCFNQGKSAGGGNFFWSKPRRMPFFPARGEGVALSPGGPVHSFELYIHNLHLPRRSKLIHSPALRRA